MRIAKSFAAARGAAFLLPLALFLALAPVARAQQGWAVELRAGAVASTALVEDAIATRRQLEALGLPGREATPVTVRAAPAPVLGAAMTAVLRPELTLEVSGGYTASELVAVTAGTERRLQDLRVGHAVVALKQRVTDQYDVSAGLGMVRYASSRDGIFREGPELMSVTELGAGGAWRAGPVRLTLRALGQMHRFGTTALRAEGGLDGRVYRVALLGGVGLAGGRSR